VTERRHDRDDGGFHFGLPSDLRIAAHLEALAAMSRNTLLALFLSNSHILDLRFSIIRAAYTK
jgi:hypothetical protein